MGQRLVRTDKNGTQYWVDDRCPKCGGTGYIECYAYHDGGICYQCGGSGYGQTSWKVYTPEYQAKLNERRQARNEKRKNDFAEHLPEYFQELGLTSEGHCFVVLAPTFGKSDELKADGARFNGSWWYLDHDDQKWETAEYDASKIIIKDLSKKRVLWFYPGDDSKGQLKYIADDLRAEKRKQGNLKTTSEFYGAEGDKVQVEVILDHMFKFDTTDWTGHDCTKYGFKFSDDAGHHFVWITGKDWWSVLGFNLGDQEFGRREAIDTFIGKTFSLKGSVKAHKEREGLKETVLTRCKILAK